MPLSWVVRDALGQLSVLVARKGVVELHLTGLRPVARSSDVSPLTPADVGHPENLSAADTLAAIHRQQLFLRTLISPEEMAEAAGYLMTLAKQYEQIDCNKVDLATAGGKAKALAPSTQDKKQTIDDRHDSSITFLLLDTLCQLMTSVAGLDGGAQQRKTDLFRLDQRLTSTTLHSATPTAAASSSSSSSASGGALVFSSHSDPSALAGCGSCLPFAFNYLSHLYTPAVRYAAARVLGVLSSYMLDRLVPMFVDKLVAARKGGDNAQREVASYQRAVGFLDFRVGNPVAIKSTLDYLTALSTEMQKHIDRGVLRQEVCASLDALYSRILSPQSTTGSDAQAAGQSSGFPIREAEWQSFLRGERGVEDWNVLYEKIFGLLAKWSSKTKHALFCFETMTNMLVYCRNLQFFLTKKRMDVIGELIKVVKKEHAGSEARLKALHILRGYFDTLPEIFLKNEEGSNEFQAQIRSLLPIVLPKKTKPVSNEIADLTELLAAMARRNLQVFINEYAIEVLKPQSPYYSRQKALMLAVLAELATERPAAFTPFHQQLGPLIAKPIEDSAAHPELYHAGSSAETGGGDDSEKSILLLRAALRCFPYIRHAKMEHVQVTAVAVMLLATHEDREISGSVSVALQRFCLLDLNQYFLPTLHTLLDRLKLEEGIDTRPDLMIKIANTCTLLAETLAEVIEKQNRNAALDGAAVGGAGGEAEAQAASSGTDVAAASSSSPISATGSSVVGPVALFQVTPTAWLALREHMESVCLMRLCHWEGWVRAELLRMLHSFARSCFRELEQSVVPAAASGAAGGATSPSKIKDVTDIPYLIDFLAPCSKTSDGSTPSSSSATATSMSLASLLIPTPEQFYRPLHHLLTAHADRFRGVISYAFSFLHRDVLALGKYIDVSQRSGLPLSKHVLQEDWWMFWRNKLLFCCLATKSSNMVGESVEGVVRRETSSGGIPVQELALKYTTSRPRLLYYQPRMHEVYNFMDCLITFLQTTPPSLQGLNSKQLHSYNTSPESSGLYLVKWTIAKDLGQIRPGMSMESIAAAAAASSSSPARGAASSSGSIASQRLCNFLDLVGLIRRPLTEAEAATVESGRPTKSGGGGSAKKRGLSSFNVGNLHESYYYNEFIVQLLARMFSQVDAEDYHSEPNLLTKVLDDFVSEWLSNLDKSSSSSNELDLLRNLPVRTRLHHATLLTRFLAFRASFDLGKQHSKLIWSKFELLKRRTQFFQVLTALMSSSSESISAATPGSWSNDAAESLRALETGVLQGLVQLLALDPLGDQQLESQILYVLERLLVLHHTASGQIPKHLHQGLSTAFSTFLNKNTKYVQEFVRMSLSESHQHLEATQQDAQRKQQQAAAAAAAQAGKKSRFLGRKPSLTLSKDQRHLVHRQSQASSRPVSLLVARYYLRALASNWSEHLATWVGTYNFSVAGMLLVSLMAQVSPDPESRAIGLLLARNLENYHWNTIQKQQLKTKNEQKEGDDEEAKRQADESKADSIDDEDTQPLLPVRLYSHESPHMYERAAQQYSRSLAQHHSYLGYLVPLLSHAVTLIGYLRDTGKECLLRLLAPWVHETATLVRDVEEEQSKIATGDNSANVASSTLPAVRDTLGIVLTRLTDLTRLSHKSSILSNSISAMWLALLSNEALNETLIALITEHVIAEYETLVEASDAARQSEVEKSMVAPALSKAKSASTPAAPAPLSKAPSVLRAPSTSKDGAPSPTNVESLSNSGVTNVPADAPPPPKTPTAGKKEESGVGSERKDEKDQSVPSTPVAVSGSHAVTLEKPVGGDDESAAAAQPNPLPSPVQDAHRMTEAEIEGDGPAYHVLASTASSPQPSPEPHHQPRPSGGAPAADRPGASPTFAQLSAGGSARAAASLPVHSPSQTSASASTASPATAARRRQHEGVGMPDLSTMRGVRKEQVLLKFILMSMLRSRLAADILRLLIAGLRSYQDTCPNDPDQFLKWTEARLVSSTEGGNTSTATGAGSVATGGQSEILTIRERATFELLSNAVFEQRRGDGQPRSDPASEETDLLYNHYPLLLQNAYVLFPRTPEGYEMLTHLVLALDLYDCHSAPTGEEARSNPPPCISSDKLIPRLTKHFPQLRHEWSSLALAWACNSQDTQVSSLSWMVWSQLEQGSFFFGERNQEVLVRAELMLFDSLRRGEGAASQSKSIVRALVNGTAFQFDKLGWSSLVVAGWSMLTLSSINHFTLGLTLMQCVFNRGDIAEDDQRKWILSLGRFLCKDGGQEIDSAVVDVLFKGLTSPLTFQPTVLLLQSLSDIYSGATLPADNKVLQLLILCNVFQSMQSLQTISNLLRKNTSGGLAAEETRSMAAEAFETIGPRHTWPRSAATLPPRALAALDEATEKRAIRSIDDCINLSLLLHQYATTSPEAPSKIHLSKLAMLFKNLALSMARVLPDVYTGEVGSPSNKAAMSPKSAHKAAMSNWQRQLLFRKMQELVQSTSTSDDEEVAGHNEAGEGRPNPFSNVHSPRIATEALDGVHLPTPAQLASQLFIIYTQFFHSVSDFNFTLSFFIRMLAQTLMMSKSLPTAAEWRTPLLLMAGYFLLESGHFPEIKHVQSLAEILAQCFCSSGLSQPEAKLPLQVAYILIEKRPNGDNLNGVRDLFNFVRPKPPGAHHYKTSSMTASSASSSSSSSTQSFDGIYLGGIDRADLTAEFTDCLQRFESHTFPLLSTMLSTARPLSRPMDEQGANRARKSHARSSSIGAAAALSSGIAASPAPASSGSSSMVTPKKPSSSQRLSFASLSREPSRDSEGAASNADVTVPAAALATEEEDGEEEDKSPEGEAEAAPPAAIEASNEQENASAEGEGEGEGAPAAPPVASKEGDASEEPKQAAPAAAAAAAAADASDDEDDSQFFAVATRKLSEGNSQNGDSRRSSISQKQVERSKGERQSDDDDEA